MSAWTRLSSFQNMLWFFSNSYLLSKPFNSHIKFVILLTVSHTFLIILVWRIESCPHLQHNTFVIDRESKLWGNHIKCYKFSLVIWNLKKREQKEFICMWINHWQIQCRPCPCRNLKFFIPHGNSKFFCSLTVTTKQKETSLSTIILFLPVCTLHLECWGRQTVHQHQTWRGKEAHQPPFLF